MPKTKDIGVAEYIAKCPREARGDLAKIRTAVREAAPGATERTDYFQWPGYSYPGFDYDGMFAWFSFKAPNMRLHVRPPVIQDHAKELVKASVKVMKEAKAKKEKSSRKGKK
jgi:uncharacterized protein YdhG (YjbR/CyaY superfamily)